jgi:hypothetical protein
MSKRQYLELMGIDVWQKRMPRQAPPREAQVSTRATAVEPALADTGQIGSALLADVKASLSAQSPVPSVLVQEAPTEVVQPTREVPEPAPEFFMVFSHFANLSMVNLYPNGFASIPGNHQRFLTTLYFALRGEKLGSEIQEFRWPMLKSDRISQSRDDAKQVLGRHIQQCQPDVLVFGAEAADLLSAPEVKPYSVQVVRDRSLIVVDDAEVYFRDPALRRDLWSFLREVRHRLRSRS